LPTALLRLKPMPIPSSSVSEEDSEEALAEVTDVREVVMAVVEASEVSDLDVNGKEKKKKRKRKMKSNKNRPRKLKINRN
jgi:hypothetical protein